MDFVGEGLVNETSPTGSANVPTYYDIGIVEKSSTMSKEFLDVGTPVRSITYRGMRVGELSLNFAFGEIVNGSFVFAGNGYDLPSEPIRTGRVTNLAGSDQPLDATNGFGWLLVDGQDIDICLESLAITLNNNLSPQNCIGLLAPQDQVLGSAAVTFESTMHLGTTSFDLFMPNKLTQKPISLSFYTRDFAGNGYGVTMFRTQVNFPDPSATGRDENVVLEASGTASYDEVADNTLRIYIL